MIPLHGIEEEFRREAKDRWDGESKDVREHLNSTKYYLQNLTGIIIIWWKEIDGNRYVEEEKVQRFFSYLRKKSPQKK